MPLNQSQNCKQIIEPALTEVLSLCFTLTSPKFLTVILHEAFGSRLWATAT